MKTLVLDGVEYVKASEAAKAHGYTSDYVGQLCRSGKVKAHLVGRSWYVCIDSLLSHRKGRYRSNQKKTKEAVAEAKAVLNKPEPHYEARLKKLDPINYEEDSEALVPTPRKVAVSSEEESPVVERDIRVVEAEEEASEYYLETTKHEKPTRGNLTIISDETDQSEGVLVEEQLEEEMEMPKLTNKKPRVNVQVGTHADITARIDKRLEMTTTAVAKELEPQPALEEQYTPETKTVVAKAPMSPVPVIGSLALGVIVVSLMIGVQWHFEGGETGGQESYRLSLSSVIKAFSN